MVNLQMSDEELIPVPDLHLFVVLQPGDDGKPSSSYLWENYLRMEFPNVDDEWIPCRWKYLDSRGAAAVLYAPSFKHELIRKRLREQFGLGGPHAKIWNDGTVIAGVYA